MFDKRLMEMCPESKRYIAGNVLMQWLEMALNTLMILIIARLCGSVYAREISMAKVLPSAALIVVITAARRFASQGAVRMSYMAAKTVRKKLREQIYAKLLRLGTSYREHASTAELVQESVEGVDQLESYFGQYVPQFFYAFLAPLTLFILFGLAGSWKVAGVLLVCVPLIPGAIMVVQKIAKKLLAKYWDQYAQLGSTFLENLQGMTALKIYQADAYKNEQMNKESEHFREVTMKVLTMQLNSIIIMDFVAYGGAALGIVLACSAYLKGNLSLASCIFMILLSADFFLPMRRLGSYFHVAMNGLAASNRIFTFLAEEEPAEKTETLTEENVDIVLSHVSFSYTPEREVLHDITMDIPAGSFTGIVGESGSGKSTIASLILGRNTAKNGCITAAGKDIGKIREDDLFKEITYIGPNAFFFKGTVRDNLAPASPNADDAVMQEALKQCGIAEFLDTQEGLDTMLSENAGNLSGGQRQRLALARALLHDSPVYIFDEATSNIDTESEETILQTIKGLRGKKTVLMITHRLANVVSADRIWCLDQGFLAGSGTHEELLQTCGKYAELWKTQKELEDFGKESGR